MCKRNFCFSLIYINSLMQTYRAVFLLCISWAENCLKDFQLTFFFSFLFFFLFFPSAGKCQFTEINKFQGMVVGFFISLLYIFIAQKKEKNQMGVDKVRACTDTSFWTCRVLRLPLFKVFCVVKKWTIYLFIYLFNIRESLYGWL